MESICATGAAEPRQRRRLDHVRQPRIERRDHRTVERIGRIELHRAIKERTHLERPGQAADARAVDFAGGLHIGRDMNEFLRDTSSFRLATPRGAARPLIVRAAGQRQHQGCRNGKWQNATRHGQDMRAIS